jgi:hypothetical protein
MFIVILTLRVTPISYKVDYQLLCHHEKQSDIKNCADYLCNEQWKITAILLKLLYFPISFTQKMPSFKQGQQFTLFKARKHFKCYHTTTGFLFQLNVRQHSLKRHALNQIYPITFFPSYCTLTGWFNFSFVPSYRNVSTYSFRSSYSSPWQTWCLEQGSNRSTFSLEGMVLYK